MYFLIKFIGHNKEMKVEANKITVIKTKDLSGQPSGCIQIMRQYVPQSRSHVTEISEERGGNRRIKEDLAVGKGVISQQIHSISGNRIEQ